MANISTLDKRLKPASPKKLAERNGSVFFNTGVPCLRGHLSLLCGTCNQGIGLLKHSPDLLRNAALYCEAAK